MSYDKTNSGTLGRNKDKNPDDPEQEKWPDHKGMINVDGNDYYLSAWVKTNSNTGEKFFSLKVKRKESDAKPEPKPQADFDDDIPF